MQVLLNLQISILRLNVRLFDYPSFWSVWILYRLCIFQLCTLVNRRRCRPLRPRRQSHRQASRAVLVIFGLTLSSQSLDKCIPRKQMSKVFMYPLMFECMMTIAAQSHTGTDPNWTGFESRQWNTQIIVTWISPDRCHKEIFDIYIYNPSSANIKKGPTIPKHFELLQTLRLLIWIIFYTFSISLFNWIRFCSWELPNSGYPQNVHKFKRSYRSHLTVSNVMDLTENVIF